MKETIELICETCSKKLSDDSIFLIRAGNSLICNCKECYEYNGEIANLDRSSELLRPRLYLSENDFTVELIGKVNLKTYLIKKKLNL